MGNRERTYHMLLKRSHACGFLEEQWREVLLVTALTGKNALHGVPILVKSILKRGIGVKIRLLL